MPFSGVQTCALDRKSTRLNSSHTIISYAVFCLKKEEQAGLRLGAPARVASGQHASDELARDTGQTSLRSAAGHSTVPGAASPPMIVFFKYGGPPENPILPPPRVSPF